MTTANSTEKIILKVDGMTCHNCAINITKGLEKKGLKNVNSSFANGEVSFDEITQNLNLESIKSEIGKLGYQVLDDDDNSQKTDWLKIRFLVSLAFTIPLLLHMLPIFDHEHILNNPTLQLILSTPVFLIGMHYFAPSAFNSIKNGTANMDVLVTIGSFSAYVYSIWGSFFIASTLHEAHQFLFFETAASIITLILIGNVLEKRAVKKTGSAINELLKLQKTTAKKLIGENQSIEVEANSLIVGDFVIVANGDNVPMDGRIVSGELFIDESIITGESTPVDKTTNSEVFAGTVIKDGNATLQITKIGGNTVLGQIIKMVKEAQTDLPPIQKLGDKISAIFVPTVILIAIITFLVSFYGLNLGFQSALMRFIAVLVISCPCAMGLATPTAVMVGLGRAAKRGILVRKGSALEDFSDIKTIVFDKTGTLTTGEFQINEIKLESNDFDLETVKAIVKRLEMFSVHPIAKSLVKAIGEVSKSFYFKEITEVKGEGIKGIGKNDEVFFLGKNTYSAHTNFDLMLTQNNNLIALISIGDELKSGVKQLVQQFKNQNIKTILLSGDNEKKCKNVSELTGIEEIYHSCKPDQKLEIIRALKNTGKLAYVGDGINDAPSLESANVGISFAKATQVAIHSSDVVLLQNTGLEAVWETYTLSKKTLKTIKQNLFWAFFYNVVAIPIAAAGLLVPTVAAFSMALSDLFVIGNSLRLKFKKI